MKINEYQHLLDKAQDEQNQLEHNDVVVRFYNVTRDATRLGIGLEELMSMAAELHAENESMF